MLWAAGGRRPGSRPTLPDDLQAPIRGEQIQGSVNAAGRPSHSQMSSQNVLLCCHRHLPNGS